MVTNVSARPTLSLSYSPSDRPDWCWLGRGNGSIDGAARRLFGVVRVLEPNGKGP